MNGNIGNQTINAPFVPDEEQPYIFVSYAHADRNRVFPIIKRIYEEGWRVWYDEGLELGNDYYGSLKKHIRDCAIFLLFLSQNALNSYFITTSEIPHANEYNKKIVVLQLNEDCKDNIPELSNAAFTNCCQLETELDKIKFLQKTRPRRAVERQININVLRNTRDSCFDYVKCKGGIRITRIKGNDTAVIIPDVYPPFSDLNVADVDEFVFWTHTNLEKVYLPSKIKGINLAAFINNKQLKDVYVPANVKLTNEYGFDLTSVPYVIHCAKNSPAHMFASDNGLKTIVEKGSDTEKHSDTEAYAYMSVAYGEDDGHSFETIMKLSKCRCNYIWGRMGRPSKKKNLELIQNCACFVAFINKRYIATGIIDDLRTAIDLGKKIVIYQTEECDLPDDLADLQSIHQLRYNVGNENERTVKLINWLTENKCRDSFAYDDFDYKAEDEGILLTKYVGRHIQVYIEPFFGGVPVISVSGFYGCDFIKTVDIPEGVKEIGFGAFGECTNLRTVNIPSSVTTIKDMAFYNCIRLEHLDIPKNVKQIGREAFSGCVKLKSIIIPEGVTNISSFVFSDCQELKTIELPSSLEKIDANAFSGCVKLKSIIIPEGVMNISSFVFTNCRELKTIELPSSLEKIDADAFSGCDNLEKIVVRGLDTKVIMTQCALRSVSIFCKKGSWMQLHCDKFEIPYTLLDM